MILLLDFYDISRGLISMGFPWWFLWNFKGMSMGFPLDFYQISKGSVWYFCDVSMGFLWDSYGISMMFLLDFYDISMGLLWDVTIESKLKSIENKFKLKLN